MYLSGTNEKGRQQHNESEKEFVMKKEYVWRQQKDYARGENMFSLSLCVVTLISKHVHQ